MSKNKSKLKKTAELKDLNVLMISIVGKGANNKKIVWKSKDAKDGGNLKRLSKIVKFDEEKKIAYCIVYPANEIDAHGEWASPETVEKAMHGFMKQSNMNAVDTDHTLEVAKDCNIVEIWLVKDVDALFPEDEHAWACGIKIENKDIEAKIKDGTYTGFSLYGFAQVEEGSEPGKTKSKKAKSDKDKSNANDNDEGSKVMKELRNLLNKAKDFFSDDESYEKLKTDFNEAYIHWSFISIVDAFSDAFWSVLHGTGDPETQKEGINQVIDDMKQALMAIEVAKDVTEDDEDATNKLKKGIEVIQKIKKLSEKYQQGDTDMNKEEVQKMIDDSVEASTKDLKEKNDELSEENKELKSKVEALEKKTPGSAQDDDIPANEQKPEEKSKCFAWTTGQSDVVKSKKKSSSKDDDDGDDE